MALIFGALLLWTPLSHSVLATTFDIRPFEETVADTPILVRGRTGMSYAQWAMATDGTQKIFTYTELELTEVLKGDIPHPTTSLMMRSLGGSKDGTSLEVPGSARFNKKEDVVVFLNPVNPDGSHDVKGMMLGKLEIRTDEQGQEYLSGGALSRREHSGSLSEGITDQTWSLTRLRSLIAKQRDLDLADKNSQPVENTEEIKKPLSDQKKLPQASDLSASPLQPSELPRPSWVSLLLACVLGLGGWFWIRKRRKP